MRGLARALLLAVPAAALACGAFGGGGGAEPASPGDGGSIDAPVTPDGAAVDDGGPGDASAPVEAGLECTPWRAPSCVPEMCAHKVLYSGTGVFPYTVVTDAAHVYWIQGVDGAPPNNNAYNGAGLSQILRGDRNGTAAPELLAQGEPWAVDLALDGKFLYYTTWETVDGGGTYPHLRRVDTTCSLPCSPPTEIPVAGWGPSVRIVKLGRAGANALFALQNEGTLYRVAISQAGAVATNLGKVGMYSGFALTDKAVYAAGVTNPKVLSVSLDGITVRSAYATVPADNDASAGMMAQATDCNAVYGMRSQYKGKGDGVVRLSLADQSVSTISTGVGISLTSLGADARWIYAGGYNGQGLYSVDPFDGGAQKVVDSSVWDITVDDVGVYWGDRAQSGAGRVVMLVK